jgi:tetratricopeptide (TPR) repeat protein
MQRKISKTQLAYLTALTLFALSVPLLADDPHWPLRIRGSSDLQAEYNNGNLIVSFQPGSGPANSGLQPGEASWLDRGFRPTEPHQLQQAISEDEATQLVTYLGSRCLGEHELETFPSLVVHCSVGVRNCRRRHLVFSTTSKLRADRKLIGGTAVNDRQLWGEQYDGNREELVQMQVRLAQQIVDQLQVELSATERNTIHQAPTKDFAAYELYLRAKAAYYSYDSFAADGKEKLEQAVLLLKEATERDSQFAEAWTLLAEVHGAIFSYGYDRSAIRQSDAYQALDQATRLQPDFGTVHLVRGTLLMQIQGKYDEATAEFQTALKTIPNSSRCYFMIGVIEWIRGHYQNVETNLIHAYELDPRYVSVISELVTWYKAKGKYDAEASLDRSRFGCGCFVPVFHRS